MDLAPLRYRLLRAIRRRPHLSDVCERSWELSPAVSSTARPAIFLPGQPEKIIACDALTNLDYEMSRIRGGPVRHAATIAYRIANATILGDAVYKGALRRLLLEQPAPWIGRGRPAAIDDAVLACSLAGNRWFAHLLTDDLPLQMAAASIGEPLAIRRPPYGHEPAYRTLLDLRSPAGISHARCRWLTIIEDFAQNPYKAERYRAMRRRLHSHFSRSGCRGAMIRRGTSGERRLLVNDAEVEAFCASRGFAIVDPEAMTVEQLLSAIMGARVIIGVDGSHLVHGWLALREGGALLTLQPPKRFTRHFKDFTDCLDMHYAFVVGDPAPEGFRINLDQLARTLDLVEKRLQVAA